MEDHRWDPFYNEGYKETRLHKENEESEDAERHEFGTLVIDASRRPNNIQMSEGHCVEMVTRPHAHVAMDDETGFSQKRQYTYNQHGYSFSERKPNQNDFSSGHLSISDSPCEVYHSNMGVSQHSSWTSPFRPLGNVERTHSGIPSDERPLKVAVPQNTSPFRHFYRGISASAMQHNHRQESTHSGEFPREFKFSKKVYVDGLFPPHYRPASVLIGTRGMNHHRMQSSGCIVQLRGKGCSQPTSQWSEEPMHLFVKYDTPAQFHRFNEILKDIVQSCKNDAGPKRPRWESFNYRLNFSPSLDNPRISVHNQSQMAAETELLYLLRAFFERHNGLVYFDELFEQVVNMFGLDALQNTLKTSGAKVCKERLQRFVRSHPHIFHLVSTPLSCPPTSDRTSSWTRSQVILDNNVISLSKEALTEFFWSGRHTNIPPISQNPSLTEPSFPQQKSTHYDLSYKRLEPESASPSSSAALQLLVQALHFLLSECPEGCSPEAVKNNFFSQFQIPLDVNCFGFSSVTNLFATYPNVFSVSGFGNETIVRPIRDPKFYGIHLPSSETTIAQDHSTFPIDMNLCGPQENEEYTSRRIPPWQQKTLEPFTSSSFGQDVNSNTKKGCFSTPRLLGLLSRLVEQTTKNTK